jgi:hypothetical protein
MGKATINKGEGKNIYKQVPSIFRVSGRFWKIQKRLGAARAEFISRRFVKISG